MRKKSEARLCVISWCLIFVGVGIRTCNAKNMSRSRFPQGFVFGTASSAYQYEGAVNEDGRGQTIWDKFSHQNGKIADSSNGDVTNDHYHLYNDDVNLMKDMGMDAYRFSLAWSRIYPKGNGETNRAGIDHYNKVIDALLAQGMEPYVTLYHWDLPQALDDQYDGWLNSRVIKDFAAYADTCFKEFGDRVKHWITFNEPHTFAIQGYDVGLLAPGRCSISPALCQVGNSSTEPYIVGHNILLSHAATVDIYNKNYKAKQNGSIGISLDTFWFEPATNSSEDMDATHRAINFTLGWFVEPLIKGEYPSIMRSRVQGRLPNFSNEQSRQLKGSYDFIGINHYTTWYASQDYTFGGMLNDSVADSGAFLFPLATGKPVHDRGNSPWLYIVPHGIRSLMNHIRNTYGNPPILITENGIDDENNSSKPIKDALKDEKRIKYHNDYLTNLEAAIKEDGCNVTGYFAWSLLDNWEWIAGYTSRFGLYYVDFNDKRKRRLAKDSVTWFKNFLKS